MCMSVCGASWYDVSCVCFTIRLLVSICFHITYSSTQHVYKHTFVYKHLVLDILKKINCPPSIPFEKYVTNYNIPWSLAASLLRNTCLFQDAFFNWKLHSSLKLFWEQTSLLQNTILLEVLQHSFLIFWTIHAFFKMLASIGKCMIVWNKIQFLFGKCIYYNPDCSLKCCSNPFEKWLPFSRGLIQLGM